MRVCVLLFLPHLLGALALHLGGARRGSPEHAGSDADGQVEGVHLVVVGVALDTVQDGDHMAQEEQVLAGEEVEQPDGGRERAIIKTRKHVGHCSVFSQCVCMCV